MPKLSIGLPTEDDQHSVAASFRTDEDLRELLSLVYVLFLEREPNPINLQAHIDMLNGGRSLRSLAEEIAAGDEARERAVRRTVEIAAAEDDMAFGIGLVYHCLLEREPDPQEVALWRTDLAQGRTVSQFVSRLATSMEARRRRADRRSTTEANEPVPRALSEEESRLIVELVYEHFLGRAPDAEGSAAYLKGLQSGMPLAQLVDEIGGSAERSRRTVALASEEIDSFIGTDEERRVAIEITYNVFLGRDPDPEGLSYYTERLRNDFSLRLLINDIANSDEGQAREARWLRSKLALG
jgi:hypothetical protein